MLRATGHACMVKYAHRTHIKDATRNGPRARNGPRLRVTRHAQGTGIGQRAMRAQKTHDSLSCVVN